MCNNAPEEKKKEQTEGEIRRMKKGEIRRMKKEENGEKESGGRKREKGKRKRNWEGVKRETVNKK